MLTLLDQIFVTDEFRAGFPGGIGGGAFREDEDADDLSRAVRERGRCRGPSDPICLGSTPRRKERVTVWSNLAGGMLLRAEMASLSG